VLNKLNHLRFSFIQLTLFYNKGIPDKHWKREMDEGGTIFFENFTTEEHEVNKIGSEFCQTRVNVSSKNRQNSFLSAKDPGLK
jgi:hypothetical protein